jgi:uncharacterized protein (DUF608 family)
MPEYSSKQKVKSGVPLGGIGAGKLEILPNGTLDYLSFQNNWHSPLCNLKNKESRYARGFLGYHFAIFIDDGRKKQIKLLQTEKISKFDVVDSIKYQGLFPFAKIKYNDPGLPVYLELEAFSSFIPGDYKNSSLPGCVFSFKARNLRDRPLEISICFSVRNTVGSYPVGRFNQVSQDKSFVFLSLLNDNPVRNDPLAGEITVATDKRLGEVSFLGDWNMQTRDFKFNERNIDIRSFKFLSREGKLPNIDSRKKIQGGGVELGGALAIKFKLLPAQEKEIPFILSWYFPFHPEGHIYQRWFKSSIEVSKYLFDRKDKLKERSLEFQRLITNSPLPYWLRDALINNLYTLFSSSWYTKNGDFVMYEAPLICPLMGTLDVNFYGSVPVSFLFPRLELSTMRLFRRAQRANGYVPHDLGRNCLGIPSDGTTHYQWKDLNPKFVLMVWRDYLSSGSKSFLRQMYPAVKKALNYSFSKDANGDFLLEQEGADTTFDTWQFYGASSYTSGLFLASLKAGYKMAQTIGDTPFASLCKDWFRKSHRNFESKLWNGSYFIACYDERKKYDSCTVGQLTGQWSAFVLGLGRIVSGQKTRKAIKSIFSLNSKDSHYGATNSVFPGGRRDRSSLHSKTIWPGVCYAAASLAIYEGFIREGLELTRKVWDNISQRQMNPWNQPDVIYPDRGTYGFGDYYLRNSVIWAVALALSSKDEKVRRTFLEMESFVGVKIPALRS